MFSIAAWLVGAFRNGQMSDLLGKSGKLNTGYEYTFNQKHKETNIDDGLIEYADALEDIDENNPLAELNAMSISDNNGGRILL